MKKVIIVMTVVAVLTACNQKSENNSENTSAETNKEAVTPTPNAAASESGSVSIRDILTAYLKMKDAFAGDDDKAAANAGNEMLSTFDNLDTSTLKVDQRKIYTDIEEDAREHAEHISKNAGNIKHQREHFVLLSKDIYQLVKAFGAGQTLYYDYCPMYNDGKDGNWLSESKKISNPYMGKKMADCGTVKEVLK